MKIRSGFVSNSSSSSFILILDSIPQTTEELRNLLNLNNTNCYKEFCKVEFTEEQYLERILKDIQNSSEMSEEELKEEFRHQAYYDPKVGVAVEKVWNAQNKTDSIELQLIADQLVERIANKMLDDFKRSYPNKHVRKITYCDNNGEFEASIEHGDLFRVAHIRINNH